MTLGDDMTGSGVRGDEKKRMHAEKVTSTNEKPTEYHSYIPLSCDRMQRYPIWSEISCSVSHTDLHRDRVASLIPRELYLYPSAGFPPSPGSRRDCAGDERNIGKRYLEAENALPVRKKENR